MADSKLRELERRWKETNSPDDEAAYLLERVRVGDLEPEKLELAAYCGHEGARRALPESRTVDLWFEADGWSQDAGVRAAVAALRTFWPWAVQQREVPEAKVALEAVEIWAVGCGGQDRRALATLGEAAQSAAWSLRDDAVSRTVLNLANAAGEIALAAAEADLSRSWQLINGALTSITSCFVEDLPNDLIEWVSAQTLREPRGLVSEFSDLAQRSIEEELVPWSLGYSDPVAIRIATRQSPSEE